LSQNQKLQHQVAAADAVAAAAANIILKAIKINGAG
jgi:hypothetical protein